MMAQPIDRAGKFGLDYASANQEQVSKECFMLQPIEIAGQSVLDGASANQRSRSVRTG